MKSAVFFVRDRFLCRRLPIRDATFATLNQSQNDMKKEKYAELFAAFGQAPMEDFLKLLFKGVSADVRKQLVLEDGAYPRINADIVALDCPPVMDRLLPESRLDDRFDEAALFVVIKQRASVSELQHYLGIGFAKASRIMSQLEANAIVGPAKTNKPREVIVNNMEDIEAILRSIKEKG